MAIGKKKKKAAEEETSGKKKKKKKGGEAESEGKKKLDKKKLILLILLLAVAAGAAYKFGLLDKFGGGGGDTKDKATVPDAVATYDLNEDSVASLTAAFEEVGDELLLSISSNALPVEETAEEEENADEDAEAPAEEEEAPAKEEEPTEDLPPYSNYYYKITGDTASDLEKYVEYLTAEATEGEDGALLGGGFALWEAEEAPQKEYVTAYQKASSSDSKKLFILEIENPLNGDAATEMFAVKLYLADKPVERTEGVTRDETMQYFLGLDHERLGLEKPIADYYIVMDMGRTYIDQNDCYGINLYNKGDGEESYFVKKFYLSVEHKKLYEYLAGDLVGLQENYTVNQGGEVLSSGESGTVHEWNIGPLE